MAMERIQIESEGLNVFWSYKRTLVSNEEMVVKGKSVEKRQ